VRKSDALGKVSEIGKIGKLAGKRRLPMGELPPMSHEVTANVLPEAMRNLEERIGTRWARQVVALQARGVLGSVPELMVYSWLEARTIPFDFQSSMFGGRMQLGGQVPDFILKHLPELLVWRVQGDYWHSRPGTHEQDRLEKAMLLGAVVDGKKVSAVVDLWEHDIYDRIDDTLKAAMVGREVGPKR
jgi:hypothetical protein